MTKSVLLIISGSIAACKTPDIVRRLVEQGVKVTCVLTRVAEQFVTPLTLASLSGNPVYSDLFSLKDETEMGHIRLSREHDVLAVVPATANIISSMMVGRADDLATAVLLATNKPVIVAPAMNTQMWTHPATQRNIAQLQADGIDVIMPGYGMLACGETGQGRLAEVEVVVSTILNKLNGAVPLKGLKALVTSGPTFEPLDAVRFIGNRSSGKQGHAVAEALARAGAEVTLVTGPVGEPDPPGVHVNHVETAQQMLAACEACLPVDIAVCAAAVADWRAKTILPHKLKKRANAAPPVFELVANPDILRTLAAPGKHRPALVVGFAAETEAVEKHGAQKRSDKGCDWIVANDVSQGKVFGQNQTSAHFITAQQHEHWEHMTKTELANRLVTKMVHFFRERQTHDKRTTGKASSRH